MDETRFEVVKSVVRHRMEALVRGEEDADNIQLFVKPEPHKVAKIQEGRLRLISGVSLVDSLVDKMIFGELFDGALRSVGKTPVMVGWNPLWGGHRLLLDQFPDGAVSVDKSAWDWSVPGWLVDVWERFVLDMYDGYPDWFLQVISMRFRMLFEKAVFEAHGVMRRQKTKGIMKSGCFLTLLLNSLGQIALHLVVCKRMGLNPDLNMPLAYGDDTIQNANFDLDAYADFMRAMGFKLKIQPVARHLEFVGFLMDEERVVPAYWRKHLFNLKYLDEELAAPTLDSYQMLYSNEPTMLRIVHQELRQRDPTLVKSQAYMRAMENLRA